MAHLTTADFIELEGALGKLRKAVESRNWSAVEKQLGRVERAEAILARRFFADHKPEPTEGGA